MRSCAIKHSVNQSHTIITLDQAVYCKAQEIRRKHPEKFKNVVLRMGAFHTMKAFLGVLGERFGDAGPQDLLVESGVVASESVQAVLSGRHYNRGIRAHKVWEALSRLRWQRFEQFLDDSDQRCPIYFTEIATAMKNSRLRCSVVKAEALTQEKSM